MSRSEIIQQARELYKQRAWTQVFSQLSKANEEKPLEPENLEKLSMAAYLTGRDSDSEDFLTRAHHDFLGRGEIEPASRCAFWLGFRLMIKGEKARGSGWISRAGRLLEDSQIVCAINGYLILPAALKNMGGGNYSTAYELFVQALETGNRFGDPDLRAMGRLGKGHALIRLGDTRKGVSLLDEAMAGVEAGEVSPMVAGIVYCAVIEACQEIFDLRRAKEWTSALSRWCESQPDMIPFRGQCLVRRAEIMQLHGTWDDAMDEVQKACELLTMPPGEPAAGEAFYRKGELHRMQGEFSKAEDAYHNASKWGRQPQPGLGRLRLAQGKPEAARKMILHLYDEISDRYKRARILSAFIDIMLDAKEMTRAHEAADELTKIADETGTPYLQAIAAQAYGSLLLAEGECNEALHLLRQAWSAWEKLEAPYFSARVRVLIGLACRELGDTDTAMMEFDAARWIFKRLGAEPDLARLDLLTRSDSAGNSEGLSPRQLEVLRLVAAGESNKAIANLLFISDRTVERHVSDIFAKLNVSSRAAATAYAYKYKLV